MQNFFEKRSLEIKIKFRVEKTQKNFGASFKSTCCRQKKAKHTIFIYGNCRISIF